jgi:uncharacterized protein (DUF1684 family)
MTRLQLLDWRRQVAAIYHGVRGCDDAAAAHEQWVARRTELHRTHPESAARDLVLRHAPYDARMRFVVPVDTSGEQESIDVATATDGVVHYERVGQVRLGELGTLDVWWAAVYGGGIWLPVRDPSPQTYGGGRYVLDTVKGADLGSVTDAASGRDGLVVDLNFAYNPSCAYDEEWACPLPPAGNVLTTELPVGELLPVERERARWSRS